ncbi:MAG: hypothetical protein CMF22_11415 [Idiomarinaceae bacterium]|nr:hypothetical protein [Idiomarinaceae bacterium]|tara:strand:- start:98298 stop:99836 length:1539 start_codon:yes stop_codon:yes gene_type:complete
MSTQYNVDYAVVKKPNQDAPLTEWEVEEYIKCFNDPMYFFTNYCYVVGDRGKMLFQPRDYQSEMVDTVLGNRFIAFNAPRQVGKSTVMGLIILHTITFTPDFEAGITSFRLSGCKDFMSRIKFSYENLPQFLKQPVLLYNQSEVKFSNGSSVYAQVTSDQTFRGKSPKLAVCDEFAFCSPLVAEDFYTSFIPALQAAGEDSKTKVVFISTPNGSSGKYADICFGAMSGSNGFVYHKVDHTKIPNRTEKFRQDMINKLGKNKYSQEFEGAWLSDSGTLIDSRVLEGIKTKDPIRSYGSLDLWCDSFQGRTVAMACDVSDGVGKDNHVIQLVDVSTLEQIGEFANNSMNQTQYFKEMLKIIHLMYNEGVGEVYFSVENNGLGNGVLRLIDNSEDPYMNQVTKINDVNEQGMATGRSGLITTHKTKLAGCAQFKDLVESERLTINSAKLIVELRFFVRRGSSFAAETGAKDDRPMAMVILMNMLKQIANYEDGVYEVMNEVTLDSSDDEYWGIVF